jgi:hypothetical protein
MIKKYLTFIVVTLTAVTTCTVASIAHAKCVAPSDFSPSWDEAMAQTTAANAFQAAVAANTTVSFPYVRSTIEKLNPMGYCVSGIALTKNIYQYYKTLLVVKLALRDGSYVSLPLLIQMASVQAFENRGPKPWVGVSTKDLSKAAAELAQQSKFQPLQNPTSVADFKSRVVLESNQGPSSVIADSTYIGDVTLATDPVTGNTLVLVTQITSTETGNIFTSAYGTRGWLLQIGKTGLVESTGYVPSLFKFMTDLDASTTRSLPRPGHESEQLLDLIQ